MLISCNKDYSKILLSEKLDPLDSSYPLLIRSYKASTLDRVKSRSYMIIGVDGVAEDKADIEYVLGKRIITDLCEKLGVSVEFRFFDKNKLFDALFNNRCDVVLYLKPRSIETEYIIDYTIPYYIKTTNEGQQSYSFIITENDSAFLDFLNYTIADLIVSKQFQKLIEELQLMDEIYLTGEYLKYYKIYLY